MTPKEIADMAHKRIIELMGKVHGKRAGCACLDYAKDLVDAARMIITQHPYNDGNKRVSYLMYRLVRHSRTPYTLPDDPAEVQKIIDMFIEEDREWLEILGEV